MNMPGFSAPTPTPATNDEPTATEAQSDPAPAQEAEAVQPSLGERLAEVQRAFMEAWTHRRQAVEGAAAARDGVTQAEAALAAAQATSHAADVAVDHADADFITAGEAFKATIDETLGS